LFVQGELHKTVGVFYRRETLRAEDLWFSLVPPGWPDKRAGVRAYCLAPAKPLLLQDSPIAAAGSIRGNKPDVLEWA
jgi:hypothetical protein